jgi:hypothetical protein
LGRHRTFKSQALWRVRDGRGLNSANIFLWTFRQNGKYTEELIMPFDLFIIDLFNPLEPELSVQSPAQKIWYLNGHPLLCMFLANDLVDV